MSASLVGSEMCIRDSRRWGRMKPLKVAEGAHSGIQRPKALLSRCCCPVSYTHLTLPTICSV
eukprot:14996287-Alexandrium_andersonii.AAC.1